MDTILKALAALMKSCELNYEFERWTGSDDVATYWVGEYFEVTDTDESGFSEHAPILSGFCGVKNYASLLTQAEMVRQKCLFGRGRMFGDTRVIIFINRIQSIPQQDNIRRIEITLKVLAWEGVTNA